MTKATLRLLCFWYTFLGIFAIKFCNKEFVNFKLISLFNFVKVSLVNLYITALMFSPVLRVVNFTFDPIASKSLSIMTRITTITLAITGSTTVLLLICLQISKQKKILFFLNSLASFELTSFYSKKLRLRWCLHFSCFSVLFVFITTIQFLTRMKYALIPFLLFSISTYTYVIIASFLSFFKSVEFIFTILLEEFTQKLSKALEPINFNKVSYKKLSRKHRVIHKLAMDFNVAFGAQLTLLSCIFIFMLTFQVI